MEVFIRHQNKNKRKEEAVNFLLNTKPTAIFRIPKLYPDVLNPQRNGVRTLQISYRQSWMKTIAI